MNFYKLDYTIDKVLSDIPTPEQARVKKYLGADLPAREAKYLWNRIIDHKWNVSERLQRDVGFRTAAIDYFENFYEPFFFADRAGGVKNSVREFLKIIFGTNFLRPKSL
jgi:hypothetical protein